MRWLLWGAVASGFAQPAQSEESGEIVARLRDLSLLDRIPHVASWVPRSGDGHVVTVVPAHGARVSAVVAVLAALPEVRWVHADRVVWLVEDGVEEPQDPYFGRQWHLQNTGQHGYLESVDLGVVQAWAVSRAEGIRIGVLDSGVDLHHPDLWVVDGPDQVDHDASSDPTDGNPHGTAVAGIIAARADNRLGVVGVAPSAEIYSVRVTGGPTTVAHLRDGIVQAVDEGADVLNASWGLPERCLGYQLPEVLVEALDHAERAGRRGNGTVVVVSVGNEGCDVSHDGLLRHPFVIGVGASTGHDAPATFSNHGRTLDLLAPAAERVVTTDIAGVDGGGSLDGDVDYRGSFGGTSAAAPMVAGVAALMIGANPRMTAADVRSVLCETAIRYAGEEPSLVGCGRVDADAAVHMAANAGPPEVIRVPPEAVLGPGRVVLAWEVPRDPDSDPITYDVQWERVGSPGGAATSRVDDPRLELPEPLQGGEVVRWRVRALDRWGPAAFSRWQELRIVDPTSGCGTSGPTGASMWLCIVGLVVTRVGRRQPERK